MKTRRGLALLALVIATGIALFAASMRAQQPGAVGIFEKSGDVGTVLHPGSTIFHEKSAVYGLEASGENIWGNADAFQFAWKKMSGDFALAATIVFEGKGVNPHRKAVLMMRKSLDPGSPYVDAALHGSGLLALQYRESPSAITTEIETMAPIYEDGLPIGSSFSTGLAGGLTFTTPMRISLVKRNGYAYLYMGDAMDKTGKLLPTGAAIPVPFDGDFYVGIGLSAHEKDVVEKAQFSHVTLEPLSAGAALVTEKNSALYSTLETVAIDSTIRTIKHVEKARFEAPNWTRDGAQFLFNRDGRIWRFPAAVPEPIPVGVRDGAGCADACHDRHGLRDALQQRPRHLA